MYKRTLTLILLILIASNHLNLFKLDYSLSEEPQIIDGDFIINDENGDVVILHDVFDKLYNFTGGVFSGSKYHNPSESKATNHNNYSIPTPKIVDGDFIIIKDGQKLILNDAFPKDFKSPNSIFSGVKK